MDNVTTRRLLALRAELVNLRDGRLLVTLLLGGVAVVTGDDISIQSKQVAAQGGAIKITVLWIPGGDQTHLRKPMFNNQFARCGETYLSILKTSPRTLRLARRLNATL